MALPHAFRDGVPEPQRTIYVPRTPLRWTAPPPVLSQLEHEAAAKHRTGSLRPEASNIEPRGMDGADVTGLGFRMVGPFHGAQHAIATSIERWGKAGGSLDLSTIFHLSSFAHIKLYTPALCKTIVLRRFILFHLVHTIHLVPHFVFDFFIVLLVVFIGSCTNKYITPALSKTGGKEGKFRKEANKPCLWGGFEIQQYHLSTLGIYSV